MKPTTRSNYHKWTSAEDKLLMEQFANRATQDIADALGLTYSQVKSRATFLQISKSHDYLKGLANSLVSAPKKREHKPTVFTQQALEYVQEHNGKMKTKDIAAHIGTTEDSLRKQISLWRAKGHHIPQGRAKSIGHVSYRTVNGVPTPFVKTADGWRRQQVAHTIVVRKAKPSKITVEVGFTPPKKKPATPAPKRQVKAQPKRLATRVQDLSTRERVYIPELRMHVYVDPGKTISQVREKYFSQREFVNKAYAR